MNTHAEKAQENKSQSVFAADSQMQSGIETTFQFEDNRPEAVMQRKLQEMANNSPQAKQAAQLQAIADNHSAQYQQPTQKRENKTGLPDNLKSGIENLSGYSMDDVKVHYNSDKPAQLQAHAYAQGTDIHIASGQEKHLPHEAWHVAQQKQGRVKPTMQMKGKVNVNDDAGLEKEADVMGAKALQLKYHASLQTKLSSPTTQTIQRNKFKEAANIEAAKEGGMLDQHIKEKGDQTKLIGVKGGQGRAAELSGAADVQKNLGLKEGADSQTGIKESLQKLMVKVSAFLAFDNSANASVLADAYNGGLSDEEKWNVIVINSEFMSLIKPGLSINKIIPDNKVNNIVATGNMNASKPEDLAKAWDNALGGSVADSTNYDDGLKANQAVANFGLDYGGYEEIDDQGKAHPLYRNRRIADISPNDKDREGVDKGWAGLSPYVKEVGRDNKGHAKLDTVPNVFYVKVQVPEKELPKFKVPLHESILEYARKKYNDVEPLIYSPAADPQKKAEAKYKFEILTRFFKYAKADDGMTVSSLSDGKTKNIEDPLTNLGITKPGSRLITQYGTLNQEYHLGEVVPVNINSGLWLKDSTGQDTQLATCYEKFGKVLFEIIPAMQDKLNIALAENKEFHK